MVSPRPARPELRTFAVEAAALLVLAAVLLAVGLRRGDAISREAGVYEAVCRSVLANTRTGRQALVCSAWWPPIPALLRMPLAAMLPRAEGWPFASLALSALAAAGALLLLLRTLSGWGIGPARLLFAGALAAHPVFLRIATDGSNGTIVLWLALLAAVSLADWPRQPTRLRHLVHFALAAALLVASGIELAPWLAAAFLLLALTEAATPRPRAQREAILILAVLPAASMIALWFVMNWLIMGDPLHFLRGLLADPATRPATTPLRAALGPHEAAALALCALAAGTGALRRDRSALTLGLLGLALPVAAALFAAYRLPWSAVPLLFLLHPMALLVLAGAARNASGRRRAVAAAAAAVFALAAWAPIHPAADTPVDAETLGVAHHARDLWLPRIEAHLRTRGPHARVFVGGFDSFLLLGHEERLPFVHALDFDVRAAEDAHPGHPLYLLVHRPTGRSAMDSVHWRYERMYELGSPHTLYNSDWGPWRLFEIVRAPR